MIRFIVTLSLLLMQTQLFAQTSISGVINSYTKVSNVDSCTNRITVQNSTAFQKGARALIIQMKGATINEANTTAFGNIFAYRNVGNYEINTIDSIFGNTIIFKNKLINAYNPNLSVQLVTIPKYASTIVTDTLKAMKWNGNTGGIIILEADNIELNAPIDASGAGFRSGKSLKKEDITNNCNWLLQVSDYFLPKNNWRGSEKGEGIAEFVAGKEWGRGAQATGGGGGNDHNAGGGGGANIAKGGTGGRNDDKNNFSCTGANPGVGGKAINTTYAFNHFFLGGGGGAGHGNNGLATDGGDGGGIVFLLGKKLLANNIIIASNGRDAANTFGDGAGGGGGGGTIVLDMEEVTGTLHVEVKGGNGGTIDNKGTSRCFGAGGGGSGGRVIYTSPLVVTGKFDGGKNGLSINGSCGSTSIGAEKGADGYDELFPYINVAKEPFVAARITKQPINDTLCIGGEAVLSTNAIGVGLEFQWQVSVSGAVFTNLTDNVTYNGSKTKELRIKDVKKVLQNNEYQCVITNDCGEILTTKKVKIVVDSLPKADFSIAIVGNQIICTNKSQGGDSFVWNFGDGQDSDFKNPIHLFTNDGEFTVELAVTNKCGVSFYSQLITIVTAPTASFNALSTSGCAPLKVNFENKSSKNVTSYKWTFAGGSPATSTEENPSITYLKSGIYGVTLEVVNSKFKDISTQTALINVSEKPNTNFTYKAGQNANIIFTNTSTNNPLTYRWEFGDGTFAIEKDITHDFVKDSTFSVTLTSTNGCGSTSIVKEIKVETRPKAAFVSNIQKGCLPLNVKFFSQASVNTTRWNWYFPGADKDTSSQQNPSVRYSKSGIYDVYLVVKNTAGKDSIAKKSFIIIEDKPTADFDFKIDRLEVTFENKSKDFKDLKWEFNDKGKTSTIEKPTHLFSQSGSYKVTLNATNDCGTSKITKEITVTNRLDCEKITASIVPNPVSDYAVLRFNAGRNSKMPFILSSIDGKILESGELSEDLLEFGFDLSTFASGVYVLYLRCDKRIMTQRILKVTY